MAALLILGAGGHGKVVADAALDSGKWNEIVFLDDAWPEKLNNGKWAIQGKIDQLGDWKGQCADAIVAIGNNRLRMKLQSKLVSAGFEIAKIIHPSACVSRFADLGMGCVVFANAVINADAVIGDAVIINTAAIVDHDCVLGDAVHVAPGANLGGGVKVGNYSWLGIGSTVRQYLSIGSDVMVGAGAVVVCDIADGVTAIGVPARPIRN